MAKPSEWGLTDTGFRRPTYAELLDALEYKARELFGSKANLSVRSPLGIFLRIFAWVLNLLFSTLEDVYNSRFVDTAVGTSLLHLGRMIGIRLLGAQKAMGYLNVLWRRQCGGSGGISCRDHRRKAAGIQTYGNTTVSVVKADGRLYDVHFSRPTPIGIWVKVFNLVTDSKFPLDGIERIKQAIIQHIGLNTRGGLNIGQDVINVTLPTVVLKVPGVVDFDLQISSDGEHFSWKNIKIAAREKAVTDESMVIVE